MCIFMEHVAYGICLKVFFHYSLTTHFLRKQYRLERTLDFIQTCLEINCVCVAKHMLVKQVDMGTREREGAKWVEK